MLFSALVLTVALLALPVAAFSGALIGWTLSVTIVAGYFWFIEVRLERKARLAGEWRQGPESPGMALAEPELWMIATTFVAIALWVATIIQAFLV